MRCVSPAVRDLDDRRLEVGDLVRVRPHRDAGTEAASNADDVSGTSPFRSFGDWARGERRPRRLPTSLARTSSVPDSQISPQTGGGKAESTPFHGRHNVFAALLRELDADREPRVVRREAPDPHLNHVSRSRQLDGPRHRAPGTLGYMLPSPGGPHGRL